MKKVLVALAPMAGVTDKVFRALCFEKGCALATTEMVSAQGFLSAPKALRAYDFLLDRAPEETDLRVQIFGAEPRFMAEAAYKLSSLGRFNGIDINMGCPARKVTGSGGGSTLMKTPALCGEIVAAVRRATMLPVSVKMRLGWDEKSINATEIAKICEENGADMLTVHGRTREQQYAGRADWDAIARVKNAVRIPVIANGDVTDGGTALAILKQTGCDGVAIGRGALGNPFLFAEINAALAGESYTPPDFREIADTAMRHARDMAAWKGEASAMIEMRKHFAWYLRGRRGAARARTQFNFVKTLDEAAALLDALQNQSKEGFDEEKNI